MLRTILYSLFFLVFLSACSEYTKVMKSSDWNLQYTKAQEYYAEGDFYKAMTVLEEVIPKRRGMKESEHIQYMHAKCNYNLENYFLASFYFNNFTKTFPNSERAEECAFLSAMCHYKNSPEYSLDQSDTYKAIDEMHMFMTRYPNSSRVDSCNVVVDLLRAKLEKKSFEISSQYLKTQQYKAATTSFNTTLREFPDTEYKEEILFLLIRTGYELAENSVTSKKEERYDETIKSYRKFVDAFPKSKWIKQAETYYKKSVNRKKELTQLQGDDI